MLAPMRPKPIIAISIFLNRYRASALAAVYLGLGSLEDGHRRRTSHGLESTRECQRTVRSVQMERSDGVAALIAGIEKCPAGIDAQTARGVRVHPGFRGTVQLAVLCDGKYCHRIVQAVRNIEKSAVRGRDDFRGEIAALEFG